MRVTQHIPAVTMILFICLIAVYSNCVGQVSQNEADVLTAVESGIKTEKDFTTVRKFIQGGVDKWQTIPWHTDIWKARIASAEQHKPMFVWAMNGSPLGCV